MKEEPNSQTLQKLKDAQTKISTDFLQSDLFSMIFEHYPDVIFTLDRHGNFVSINHKLSEFIGYQPCELKGSFYHLIKEEYLDEAIRHFQNALKGLPVNYHCKVIHKEGHTVHLNLTIIPIVSKGEVIGVYGIAKNLTKLEQKEAELLKITNSLNLAQEVAKIGSWDYDAETNYVYCSDSLYAILGLEKKKNFVPTYENLLQMIEPEDREHFDDHFQLAKETGMPMDIEYRIQRQDRSTITARVKAEAKRDKKGKVVRIIGVLNDISEQVLTENRLKESEKKFKTIANNLDVGIWSWDILANQMVYASPGLEKLLERKVQASYGLKDWLNTIHPDDRENYLTLHKKIYDRELFHHQYRMKTASGKIKWVEDKIVPTFNEDGQLIRLDGILQDISERKRYEEEIQYLAYHDYLTELPNRRMFDKKLGQLIFDFHDKNSDKFALFYLDMDRFKFVNDTLGHEIGDSLLHEISKRLASLVGKQAAFRVGGDEFTIIQDSILAQDPVELGKKVIREIRKPFNIRGYEIHMTTSIGISIFPDDGETLQKLKTSADAALYFAKELGKNSVQLFNKSLNNESYKLFTLENDLRKAISRAEFVLHYQPRVDTITGKIVGAEALIRWNHPKWGLVYPAKFIPLAEETGIINDISEWVFHQVCRQLKEWREKGYTLVPISINLSVKTLMKAGLVTKVKECLDNNSLSPSLIEIEITEDSLIKNDGAALAAIGQLREMGISIAIDDFGTGYSSIGYLKKFKVDYIKIDRSFIKDIHHSTEDFTIVESIILLAKGFQVKIVAEGVENEKQWELLKALDCHYIQGYFFHKPLPPDQFVKII